MKLFAIFLALVSYGSVFNFIQLSDPQLGFSGGGQGYEEDSLHLQRAVVQINRLRPDFVVVTGDMVNSCDSINQLQCYKTLMDEIDKGIPVFQIPGNHDIGGGSTDERIEKYLSRYGEDHFTFRYRGCSFVGINGCVIKDSNDIREDIQEKWLRKELKKASRYRLSFVFSHQSFFVNSFEEKENYSSQSMENRDKYWKLFKKYGVDCVIAGHLHDSKNSQHDGIPMITCGPVGRPLGKGYSGVMVWTVKPDGNFSYKYLSLDEFEQCQEL